MNVYTNGCDWIFAESEEDAVAAMVEEIGTDNRDGERLTLFLSMPDRPFTFRHEDGRRETKTLAEWMAEHGRCYFACTEE